MITDTLIQIRKKYLKINNTDFLLFDKVVSGSEIIFLPEPKLDPPLLFLILVEIKFFTFCDSKYQRYRYSHNSNPLFLFRFYYSQNLYFSATTVKCQNLRGLLHELSNEGAREQFEHFLETLILPEMVSIFLMR
jgi:hypothetical protein